MFFNFLPKEEKYFDMFERVSENAIKAATKFRDLLKNYTDVESKVREIEDLEHEGDIITHEIFDKLNRTFITPIDREDIHSLASELDDVLDFLKAGSDRFVLYNIKKPTEDVINLAETLVKTTIETSKAIKALRDMKHTRRVNEYCIEINSLENEGDNILKNAIAKLFNDNMNPLDVIKWKEIYENIESAIDMCESVANTIGAILAKNA
jgi:predicted phosphate transport protein (TIGR00153 family)